MLSQVREKDISLFESLSKGRFELAIAPRRTKAPYSRLYDLGLRRGFEIGFLIVLPFLVIDMIVATLTMSMGMMMLPPLSSRSRSKSCFSCSLTAGTY